MITTSMDNLNERVLREGYGSGAWHGPDLKAALADVSDGLAFWRPRSNRHNIAEIALHHAYCARGVFAKISGRDPGPFVIEGEDWFDLSDNTRLSWGTIQTVVEQAQKGLTDINNGVASGTIESPLSPADSFDLILGITCHAAYHAGQIQLIKQLRHG